MEPSPTTHGVNALRVVLATALCVSVPVIALYSVAATNDKSGIVLGVVPLGAALWLLSTARCSIAARVGVSVVALVGTCIYSGAVISGVFRAWSS